MSKSLSIDGITSLNDTPTTTKISNSNNDSSSLDDINQLLYLEALKRFKEEEQHLRRQVEDKSRQYEDAKSEYRYLYELYVQLYQSAVTRGVLEEDHSLPSDQLSRAHSDVLSITEKVNNDKTMALFNPETLIKCKEIMGSLKNHDKAQQIQMEMAEQKEAVKVIEGLNETIPLKLEAATTQSLDFFVKLNRDKQLGNLNVQDHSHNEMDLEAFDI